MAPQDAADAGAEFGQVERLGQIVVGPEFQSLDLVVQRVAGRDDDDPGPAAALLQLFEQPQSAAAGQHDVQQDAVVVVCGDLVEGRGIVGGLLDDVLFPDQRPDHDLPQGGFVFDNQYFHNLSLVHGWFSKSASQAGGRKPGSEAFPTHHHPKTRLLGREPRSETPRPAISLKPASQAGGRKPAQKHPNLPPS